MLPSRSSSSAPAAHLYGMERPGSAPCSGAHGHRALGHTARGGGPPRTPWHVDDPAGVPSRGRGVRRRDGPMGPDGALGGDCRAGAALRRWSHHDQFPAGLMRRNLLEVFNEPDPARRAAVIAVTYTEDVVWHEPDRIIRGRKDLERRAEKLRGRNPGWLSDCRTSNVHAGCRRLSAGPYWKPRWPMSSSSDTERGGPAGSGGLPRPPGRRPASNAGTGQRRRTRCPRHRRGSPRRARAATPAAVGTRSPTCRRTRYRAHRRPDRPQRPRAHPSACPRPRSADLSSLRWSSPSLPVATGSRVGTHLPGGCREPGTVGADPEPVPHPTGECRHRARPTNRSQDSDSVSRFMGQIGPGDRTERRHTTPREGGCHRRRTQPSSLCRLWSAAHLRGRRRSVRGGPVSADRGALRSERRAMERLAPSWSCRSVRSPIARASRGRSRSERPLTPHQPRPARADLVGPSARRSSYDFRGG